MMLAMMLAMMMARWMMMMLAYSCMCWRREMDVNENPLRSDLCESAIEVTNGRVPLPTDPGLLLPPADRALQTYAIV